MVYREDSLNLACKDLEQDLVLYYYGESGETEQKMIRAHLESCVSCQRFLDELERILPLTAKPDEPPQAFWENYSAEMRRKLAAIEERSSWWKGFSSLFHPWPVAALATSLILILAVALTFTKALWRSHQPPAEEKAFLEVVSVADNLDFFKAMDFLDSMDLLEALEGKEIRKSDTKDQAL